METPNNVYEIARRRGVSVKTVQNWGEQSRKKHPNKIPPCLTYATVLTKEQEDLVCIDGRKIDNARNPRGKGRRPSGEYRDMLLRIDRKLDRLLDIWEPQREKGGGAKGPSLF